MDWLKKQKQNNKKRMAWSFWETSLGRFETQGMMGHHEPPIHPG